MKKQLKTITMASLNVLTGQTTSSMVYEDTAHSNLWMYMRYKGDGRVIHVSSTAIKVIRVPDGMIWTFSGSEENMKGLVQDTKSLMEGSHRDQNFFGPNMLHHDCLSILLAQGVTDERTLVLGMRTRRPDDIRAALDLAVELELPLEEVILQAA